MKIEEYGGTIVSSLFCLGCIFFAHDEFVNGNLFECGLFGFAAIINGAAAVMEWFYNGKRL